MGKDVYLVDFDELGVLHEMWWASELLHSSNLRVVSPDHWPTGAKIALMLGRKNFWRDFEEACMLSRSHNTPVAAIIWPQSYPPPQFSPKDYFRILDENKMSNSIPLLCIDFNAAAEGATAEQKAVASLTESLAETTSNRGISFTIEAYKHLVGKKPDEWQQEMLERAADYWGPQAAGVWVGSRLEQLGGRRPVDAIEEHDEQIVDAFLMLDQAVS